MTENKENVKLKEMKEEMRKFINQENRNETQVVAQITRGLRISFMAKQINESEYEEIRRFAIEEMKKAKYSEEIINLFEKSTRLVKVTR